MFVKIFFVVLIFCSNKQIVKCFTFDRFHNYMFDSHFRSNFNNEISNYEVVYLPVLFPLQEAISEDQGSPEHSFDFTLFGRSVSLQLKPNEKLLSPSFKTYVQSNDHSVLLPHSPKNCHYLHRDAFSVAAISICQPNLVQGLLLLDNSTYEIHPLTPQMQSILALDQRLIPNFGNRSERFPHVVRRADFTPSLPKDNFFMHENILKTNTDLPDADLDNHIFSPEAANHKPVDILTAEVALFFDAEAYRLFAPYFNYDEDKLRDMILIYLNGIQALYHHPSLGINLQLVLVRLDIMKNQPTAMPHYDGERSKLLDSFCRYQKSLNPASDDNPNHWDMALYVSGLDFFAYENGQKSGVTMGLATVGGVCYAQYACVIAEMGTTNIFGKPYPSAGFTSVYILAHEIGHNLGMHHDGTRNNCPKEGYIMSPSRGVAGETQWSSCSAEVMTKLQDAKCLQDFTGVPSSLFDHSRYKDIPGQVYTAKKQCEILLRDKDAIVSPNQDLSKVCYSIECKTPHRSGYYFAGPALEGTSCGKGMYCYGGECVSKIFPTPIPITPGGWGPWNQEPCNSSCLENSKGYQIRSRLCNNPTPVNTDRGCDGTSYDISTCGDGEICRKIARISAVDYASEQCKEFSKLLPQLNTKGLGLQAPHEDARLWMGCAIFCQKADSSSYYTPRVELNDLGVSPYFPDGTWCHKDSKGLNYFCRRHRCLPDNFQFSKILKTVFDNLGEDIPIPQNAHPFGEVAKGLQSYLSLGLDGKPLQTVLRPGQAKLPKEEDWETKDYVELPDDKINEISKDADIYDRFNFIK